MEEPVAEGVGEGGLSEIAVVALWVELAGNESGGTVITVFDDFEQVSALDGGQWCHRKIVDDKVNARAGPSKIRQRR